DLKKAAKLQFETGAISRLDYLAANNEVAEITLKKKQAFRDYQEGLQRFNQWFASDSLFTVNEEAIQSVDQPLLDLPETVGSHPILNYAEKGVEVAQADYKMKKAESLPKLNVEYSRQKV